MVEIVQGITGLLDMADSIYMLSNYENSKGACMEYGYAMAKNMIIMYE